MNRKKSGPMKPPPGPAPPLNNVIDEGQPQLQHPHPLPRGPRQFRPRPPTSYQHPQQPHHPGPCSPTVKFEGSTKSKRKTCFNSTKSKRKTSDRIKTGKESKIEKEGKNKSVNSSSKGRESNSETLFTFLSDTQDTRGIETLDNSTDDDSDPLAVVNVSSAEDSNDDEVGDDDDDDLLRGSPSDFKEDFKDLTLSEAPAVLDSTEDGSQSQGVGIFWDIENCPVPNKVSTSEFVSKIRERFCKTGCKQLEFTAIHNGKNEKLNEELHELGIDASLSVVGRKNSADEIIKDKMFKFVEKYRDNPCTLLLISGDVDFSRDLSTYRFMSQFKTILLHNKQTKSTLKSVVSECVPIENLFEETKREKIEPKKKENVKIKKAKKPSVVTEEPKRPNYSFMIHSEVVEEIPKNQGLQFFCEIQKEIKTKFSVDAVLDKNSFSFKSEDGVGTMRVQLTIYCGKRKANQCKRFINDCSEENFRIICTEIHDEGKKIGRDALRNDATKKKALKELETKMKTLNKKHELKICAIEEEITKEQFKSEVSSLVGGKNKKASKFLQDAAASLSSNMILVNLEKEVADMRSQLAEFSTICSANFKKIRDLDIELSKVEFEAQLSEVRFKLGKEFVTFENPLPIYNFRREIQETVRDSSVTILMAETGSGKSTQVVQYLHEMYPDKVIVCTQPRKIAAVSLASHVARQMGCEVGGLVGYRVGSQLKVSQHTKIVFMTDQLLVNECVKDPNFSKYHCVILDEVHERSINTDLLLGLTKNGLKTNPDLKVIITSATMDPKLFFLHFEEKESNVRVETKIIPGRTFPIELRWTNQNIDTSRDYLTASLKKVEEVLATTQRGDILVFLATPSDTDLLCNKLRDRNNSMVESLQLHGKLQIEDQKKIFEPSVKRKVIFATNCAETSVTVPGIKYVVDPGVAKEKRFDPKRNSSSLVVQKISQSSAKQRAGRAGRTEPGICYRLYSESEFSAMNTDMVAEIRRVQLGQTILKLIDLGITRPDKFPFIESPGVENLSSSISDLESLEALTVDATNGEPQLTELGHQMSKLPLDPRLSKLVLISNREGDGESALIMAALCSMAGNVFFRLGSSGDCSVADQKKINFCDEKGDFLTLVNVFTEWSKVPEKKKSQWCVENFINGKSMRMARDMFNDLKAIFRNELKTTVTSPILLTDEEERLKRLQVNIFQCFRANLCLYGGHSKVGYINVRTRDVCPIHPSSSFSYLGNITPQLIIYDQILSTSRTFLLNLSSVEESWLSEYERTLLLEAQDLVVTPFKLGPVGPRILKQSIIGFKWSELKKLEEELKSWIGKEHFLEINCNVEDGTICFATNNRFHSFVKDNIGEKIRIHQQKLVDECQEIFLIEDKSRPKAIIGAGGVLEDIILEGEFSDFMIKSDIHAGEETFQEICDFAKVQPGVIRVKPLNKTGSRVVIMRNYSSAVEALQKVKEFAEQNLFEMKNIYPLTSSKRGSSQTGIDLKLVFPRRKGQKFGFIKFDSEEDAYRVLSKMDSSLMCFGTEALRLRQDKKGDRKSLFFALNKFMVTPQNLASRIQERLKEHGMLFKEVFIPLLPQYKTTNEEINSLKLNIASLLTSSLLTTEKDFSIDIRMPNPKAVNWSVKINFSSSVVGLNVGNYLRNMVHQTITWRQTEDNLRSEYFTVDFDLTTSFSCSRKIFDVLKDTIEKTVKDVSELFKKDSESLKLDVKSFKVGESNRVVFYIKGTDVSVLARTKDALDNILTGERVDHPNIKLLLNPGTIKQLQFIEDSSDVYMEKCVKRGFITIYGSEMNINIAKSKINSELAKLVEVGHSVFHENMRNFPNGLVKEMIRKFGPDFRSLLEIEGVHSVKYLVNIRRLEVIASQTAYKQVQSKVVDLAGGLKRSEQEEEETCPVCFSVPEGEEGLRLQHCGHLYCRDCLHLALGSATWPLTCCTEGCGKNLVVEDFKVLSAEDLQKLQRKALDHKLSDVTCELKACPSPNCGGVYRGIRAGDPTEETEAFYCSLCGVNICRRCDSVFHTGMTCQFYQIYRTDNDHSLRAWLQEAPATRRFCPKCQSPIEKNGGCLHIHCIRCNTHLCWNCMQAYPSGQSVYTHICPGS